LPRSDPYAASQRERGLGLALAALRTHLHHEPRSRAAAGAAPLPPEHTSHLTGAAGAFASAGVGAHAPAKCDRAALAGAAAGSGATAAVAGRPVISRGRRLDAAGGLLAGAAPPGGRRRCAPPEQELPREQGEPPCAALGASPTLTDVVATRTGSIGVVGAAACGGGAAAGAGAAPESGDRAVGPHHIGPHAPSPIATASAEAPLRFALSRARQPLPQPLGPAPAPTQPAAAAARSSNLPRPSAPSTTCSSAPAGHRPHDYKPPRRPSRPQPLLLRRCDFRIAGRRGYEPEGGPDGASAPGRIRPAPPANRQNTENAGAVSKPLRDRRPMSGPVPRRIVQGTCRRHRGSSDARRRTATLAVPTAPKLDRIVRLKLADQPGLHAGQVPPPGAPPR
jgi:hypothetical protein